MPWKQWTEVLWLLAITRWFVYLWGFIWRSHGDFNCCFSEGLLLLRQSRSLDPWRKERYKSCEGFLSETGAHPSNLQNFGGLYNSCADYLRTKKIFEKNMNLSHDVLKICNFYHDIIMIYHGILCFFFVGFKTGSFFECLKPIVGRRWFRVHSVASTVVMVSFQLGNLAQQATNREWPMIFQTLKHP